MKISRRTIASTMLVGFYALATGPIAMHAQRVDTHAHESAEVLNRDEASAKLPSSVFFRGETASIQARNSAGLKLADGKLVLVAMVDSSGYSSAMQETYQAYLLSEVSLKIGEQILQPGAYGFGFIAGNKMVVMDIGGNEILHATTTRDESLARPTPLQILAGPTGTRLYLGRSYVPISPAER